MEVSQEEFERSIMTLLLQGDHPILTILQQQYASAKVESREFSGVGFFTEFEVSETVPLVEPPNFAAGNVDIQLQNLPNGAGCVLFIRDGKLACLECYTFSEPWPDTIVIQSLSNAIPAIPE
jgi:hypothetical protein